MPEEVKQLTGEARIDALCEFLSSKHGFLFPEEVLKTKQEKEEAEPAEEKPEAE